jgi:hypothetical protein
MDWLLEFLAEVKMHTCFIKNLNRNQIEVSINGVSESESGPNVEVDIKFVCSSHFQDDIKQLMIESHGTRN